jgi:release factor glutamine methyltransferase
MANRILSIVASTAQQLMPIYNHPQEAEQAAWWLLEKLLSQPQAILIARDTITLTEQQQQTLNDWIHQHTHDHKPLQYILETVPFLDITISVEPPILIPRPETEEWCAQLIESYKPFIHEQISMLDLCTGSGCIALGLAHAFKRASVTAIDISSHALELTQKNAQLNNISNITCIQSDMYEAIPARNQFDSIVSNPPYISRENWMKLDDSVRSWEDERALVANNDGLQLIEIIIMNAYNYLKKDSIIAHAGLPQLAIEIGYDQGDAVLKIMHNAGFKDAVIWKDLEGKDRVALNKGL